RSVPMLGLDLVRLEERAKRQGDARAHVDAVEVGKRADSRRGKPRWGCQQHRLGSALAQAVEVESRRSVVAERNLACGGRFFHLDRSYGGRAGDNQLAMAASDEEEVEDAAVDADVHLQLDGARRGLERADVGERAAHAECRRACGLRVTLSLEEEEQRVPAELHEAAAEL